MTPLALLATVVGIFLGLANLPQALKIFQRKSAKDISAVTYLIVEFGSIIWILYGFEIHSWPIIIPNFLGLLASSLVLIGYLMYGKSKK
ncbi:MAG TPA: SemiSWEET family transporter [Candidatus Saccharimonadia bacterium]|nr:SemiSWEET family transporter [Candidatus Saccharimonadia bacterium]